MSFIPNKALAACDTVQSSGSDETSSVWVSLLWITPSQLMQRLSSILDHSGLSITKTHARASGNLEVQKKDPVHSSGFQSFLHQDAGPPWCAWTIPNLSGKNRMSYLDWGPWLGLKTLELHESLWECINPDVFCLYGERLLATFGVLKGGRVMAGSLAR